MTSRYFQEYLASQRLAAEISRIAGPANEFYTLIMAAARVADTDNLGRLMSVFPIVVNELRVRYNAPGGALTPEELDYLTRWNENAGDDAPGG